MSHVYRCSSCRTRNTFRRPVESYIVVRWCRHCGHRHFYIDRERVARKACHCDGYHHAHRPGSRCCLLNAWHPVHQAKRAGHDAQELELQLIVEGKGKPHLGTQIPF